MMIHDQAQSILPTASFPIMWGNRERLSRRNSPAFSPPRLACGNRHFFFFGAESTACLLSMTLCFSLAEA
jgi:hypothetical protein